MASACPGSELMSAHAEEEQLTGMGSQKTPGPRSSAVSKLPSFLGQEHSRQDEIYEELSQLKAAVGEFPERSRQEKIYQDMAQLKAAVDHLCCPCPWDWTFFQGNCYFFSNSQRNWHDSISACQDVGAQLVVIKGDEEQLHQALEQRGAQQHWGGRLCGII
uniref:Uncharacterized protein n=1 Tax=Microcebus murinus TaxID=30608 RepID=A0A8C6EF53_MICMU